MKKFSLLFLLVAISIMSCTKKKTTPIIYTNCQLSEYLKLFKKTESDNIWTAISLQGKGSYFGLYQVGDAVLKDLNYWPKISLQKFKKNPKIFPILKQETVMRELLRLNQKRLADIIYQYDKKLHKGYFITESGILASAHLLGASNVRKWFIDKYYDPMDGNGTKLTTYLIKFTNYDLNCL